MPTSEAQIQANRQNALKSSGPRTAEGKEASRANALKHGMTGAGVVLAESDADEIKRRSGTFVRELNAVGDVQVSIAHRAALNSVRMERGADQQIATQIDQIRRLEADFVAPEDLSDEEADRLRSEAIRRAMFDPSKEAILARRHEAACERAFYKALKELRQIQAEGQSQAQAEAQAEVEQQVQELAEQRVNAQLGSFFQERQERAENNQFMDEMMKKYPPTPEEMARVAQMMGGNDLSFAVGHGR